MAPETLWSSWPSCAAWIILHISSTLSLLQNEGVCLTLSRGTLALSCAAAFEGEAGTGGEALPRHTDVKPDASATRLARRGPGDSFSAISVTHPMLSGSNLFLKAASMISPTLAP